jgi:CRP/FNR family cyclic AMP-dependent transcriptional regulator
MARPTVKFHTIFSREDTRRYLLSNSLFRDLAADALEEMVDLSRIRRFSDRSLIHARGDEPDGMFSVISGNVRASISSDVGKEALLAIFEPGSWFGESSLFDGLPRPYDAHAQGSCTLLFAPRAALETLLERQPRIYRNILQLLCQRIRLSMVLLETNALLSLEGRLAHRLLMLTQSDDQSITPEVRISQEDLSQMLGITRQSISRVLKLWESEGVIERHYRGLQILDIPTLRLKATDSNLNRP